MNREVNVRGVVARYQTVKRRPKRQEGEGENLQLVKRKKPPLKEVARRLLKLLKKRVTNKMMMVVHQKMSHWLRKQKAHNLLL